MDDELEVCLIVCFVLELFGYMLIEVEDGVKVFEIFEKCSVEIGLVVIDVFMFNFDGFGFFVCLYKFDLVFFILLFSGYVLEEDFWVEGNVCMWYLMKFYCL